MENCLVTIAQLFNEAKITWALGASMLLYYKGLVSRPNDLDLVVNKADQVRVEEILAELGIKRPANPHSQYATEYFAEFLIGDIEVDVMAGFRINIGDLQVEYYLEPENFEELRVAGTTIYLCPLEDWFVLYNLMSKRESKVQVIRGYLVEHGMDGALLESWLSRDLPPRVWQEIQGLLR